MHRYRFEVSVAVIDRSVWFFLVEVVVTGDRKQPWIKGSKASVQAFVPGTRLEDSLVALDDFLKTQELDRLDVRRAVRYDPDGEEENYPGRFFREPLEDAAARNQCVLGVFLVDDETSEWREQA